MLTINYNPNIIQSTIETLQTSDISAHLKPNMSVAIKPNLVLAAPASDGATTHPEVVEGIVIFLKDYGIKNIEIIESSWVGDNTKRAYKVCGYEELSRKYNVLLFDLKDDSCTTLKHGDLSMSLCNEEPRPKGRGIGKQNTVLRLLGFSVVQATSAIVPRKNLKVKRLECLCTLVLTPPSGGVFTRSGIKPSTPTS